MIEIEESEYNRLKSIEKKFNSLELENSIQLAQTMKNNAINVNNASKQKVKEIEDISTLVHDFIEKSHEIEEKSIQNQKSSNESTSQSQNIIEFIEELSTTINHLDTIFDTFSQTIDSLSQANKDITELVTINNQISLQTNLLSLNAKIEASRAGEAGKGFSIVADEVKKLAASSKQSTEDIGSKIDEITAMTRNVKEQSDKSNELIDNGIKMTNDATDKLNCLLGIASQNKDDSLVIQHIVDDQLKGSDTIKSKISELLEDTTKAITGSCKNIDLGTDLVTQLSSK